MLSFLKNIGTTEIIIVGLVVLALFGSKIMTGFSRGMGESVKELKKVKKELQSDSQEEVNS